MYGKFIGLSHPKLDIDSSSSSPLSWMQLKRLHTSLTEPQNTTAYNIIKFRLQNSGFTPFLVLPAVR